MELLRRLTVTQAVILIAIILVVLIIAVLTFDRGDNDDNVDFTQITPTAIIDFSNVVETTQQFAPVSTIDPLGGN